MTTVICAREAGRSGIQVLYPYCTPYKLSHPIIRIIHENGWLSTFEINLVSMRNGLSDMVDSHIS